MKKKKKKKREKKRKKKKKKRRKACISFERIVFYLCYTPETYLPTLLCKTDYKSNIFDLYSEFEIDTPDRYTCKFLRPYFHAS